VTGARSGPALGAVGAQRRATGKPEPPYYTHTHTQTDGGQINRVKVNPPQHDHSVSQGAHRLTLQQDVSY